MTANPAAPLQVVLNPLRPQDVGFVYKSWLRSLQKSRASRFIPKDLYYARTHAQIERLLERATVTVANPADDPATILGYAVHEPGVLHYVLTKHQDGRDFRGFGVATQLLAPLGDSFSCSFLSDLGADILVAWEGDNAVTRRECVRCRAKLVEDRREGGLQHWRCVVSSCHYHVARRPGFQKSRPVVIHRPDLAGQW